MNRLKELKKITNAAKKLGWKIAIPGDDEDKLIGVSIGTDEYLESLNL